MMDKKLLSMIAISVIVVLGASVYVNSLTNPFIWDDLVLIIDNLQIRHIGNIPRLFKQNIYHQDMVGRFYRPILISTFALDYKLWGFNPLGYHLTNLLLHLANAALIYYLVRLILEGQTLIPFFTALMFAVHPIQTEAVTYISGRADPLVTLFCLISFVFFIKYINCTRHSKNFYYIGSILSFIIGLLSKETAIIFPFILILYEVCFRKAQFKFKGLSKYVPFFVVLIFYGFVRHIVLSNVKEAYYLSNLIPLSKRLLVIPLAIATYFRLLIFPLGLHMEHMDYMMKLPASLFEIEVFVSLLFLIAIGIFIWKSRRRFVHITFGSLWFFLNLLPVLNIVPINAFIAEHWLYAPSIGFFLVLSAAFVRSISFRSIKPYIVAFLVGIFVSLGFLTVKQNYIWKDPIVFYKYTLRYAPQSSRLHVNLGGVYMKLKLYEEAAKEYEEALKLNPSGIHGAYVYINLGVLYETWGKEDEAIRMYEKVIELDPTFALAHNYIGNIHYRNGRYSDAIKSYRKAVELIPTNATYWNNLAIAYLKVKMLKEAAESYERALSIYPYIVVARINLGGIYAEQGNPRKALEEYEFALRLAPNMAQIYYNIGNACAQFGKLNLAKEYWERTLEIDPTYVDAQEKLKKLKELNY